MVFLYPNQTQSHALGVLVMPDDNQATAPLLTNMMSEAWQYLQDAKETGAQADIDTWREAFDVLLDSPQVARKPL